MAQSSGTKRTPAANGSHVVAFLEGSGCQHEPWCLQWLKALTQPQAGAPTPPPHLHGSGPPPLKRSWNRLCPERGLEGPATGGAPPGNGPLSVLTVLSVCKSPGKDLSPASICIPQTAQVPSPEVHVPQTHLRHTHPTSKYRSRALTGLCQDGPHPQVQGCGDPRGGKNTSLSEVSVRCGGARASPQDDSLPSAAWTLHQPPVFTRHQGPAYSPGFLNDGGRPQTPPLILSLPPDCILPGSTGPCQSSWPCPSTAGAPRRSYLTP